MTWPPKLEMVREDHAPHPVTYHCRCGDEYEGRVGGLCQQICPHCGWDPFSWVRETQRQAAQEIKDVLFGEEEEPCTQD